MKKVEQKQGQGVQWPARDACSHSLKATFALMRLLMHPTVNAKSTQIQRVSLWGLWNRDLNPSRLEMCFIFWYRSKDGGRGRKHILICRNEDLSSQRSSVRWNWEKMKPGRDRISQPQRIMLNVSHASRSRLEHILLCAPDPSWGNYLLQMSDNISLPEGKLRQRNCAGIN